ncbi:MAG TPA: hypothetical protein VGN42_07050 [Pirellulales bacterium]|nr:hypothetical protein [Pirellulales bacterium]
MREIGANSRLAAAALAKFGLEKTEPLGGQIAELARGGNSLDGIEHRSDHDAGFFGERGNHLGFVAISECLPSDFRRGLISPFDQFGFPFCGEFGRFAGIRRLR